MANQIHPDVQRRAAFKVWLSRFTAAQNAVAALQEASADAMLRTQSSTSFNGSNGLSLDKLCPRLDRQAPELQNLLDDVRRVAAKVKKIRNASTVLITIQRLPNELIRQVFNHVVFYDGTFDAFSLHKLFLKNVFGVRSLWRQICHSTPQYWGKVDFTEGYPYDRTRSKLERTGGHFLDVTMDFFSRKHPNQYALSLVVLSFSRWHSMTLRGPDNRVKDVLSALIHSKDPAALDRLPIHGTPDKPIEEASFQPNAHSFWQTLSNLTNVEIWFATFPWRLPILRNLTRLVMHTKPNALL
jgi:hypothetical protein